jgi:hypothetical protein
MAKGGVTIELTGEEADLFASLQRVVAQEKAAEVGAKDFGKAATRVSDDVQKKLDEMGLSLKEYNQLQRQAAREVAKSQTATDKYRDAVEQTNKQVELGIIDARQQEAILKRQRMRYSVLPKPRTGRRLKSAKTQER